MSDDVDRRTILEDTIRRSTEWLDAQLQLDDGYEETPGGPFASVLTTRRIAAAELDAMPKQAVKSKRDELKARRDKRLAAAGD